MVPESAPEKGAWFYVELYGNFQGVYEEKNLEVGFWAHVFPPTLVEGVCVFVFDARMHVFGKLW